MQITRNIDQYHSTRRTVVTVGTFDGVHAGHRQILEELKQTAKTAQLDSTIITFEPHPRTVIQKPEQAKLFLLTTYEENIKILESSGIEQLLVIEFNPRFAATTYQDFVKTFLVEKVKAAWIVIGHDHAFGRNRQGNLDALMELSSRYDFKVKEVGPYQCDGETVSSSGIRKVLSNGEVEKAARMLGYDYTVSGIVVPGEGRGQRLDFPTANISCRDRDKLMPRNGVYVVTCKLQGLVYRGMANLGVKPTFDGRTQTFEVHLFDFSGTIYGEEVSVSFIRRLREEIKFRDERELIQQLKQDKINSIQN